MACPCFVIFSFMLGVAVRAKGGELDGGADRIRSTREWSTYLSCSLLCNNAFQFLLDESHTRRSFALIHLYHLHNKWFKARRGWLALQLKGSKLKWSM